MHNKASQTEDILFPTLQAISRVVYALYKEYEEHLDEFGPYPQPCYSNYNYTQQQVQKMRRHTPSLICGFCQNDNHGQMKIGEDPSTNSIVSYIYGNNDPYQQLQSPNIPMYNNSICPYHQGQQFIIPPQVEKILLTLDNISDIVNSLKTQYDPRFV